MKLLIDQRGRRYLVKKGKDLHTNYGVVKGAEIEKCESGVLKSHLNKKFTVLNPNLIDFIESMEKRAQVVYPKDSSLILGLTGICSGSKIVEAGSGVAGLTLMLANSVKPDGMVYSYEIREEHLNEARKHIAEFNLQDYVEFKNKNIYDGIDERDVDLVVLDLGEPWLAIEAAAKSLKKSGFLVSYSPSVEQVKKFVVSLDERFSDIKTVESINREWEISEQRCRPKTRMIGHTGFITFARLIG